MDKICWRMTDHSWHLLLKTKATFTRLNHSDKNFNAKTLACFLGWNIYNMSVKLQITCLSWNYCIMCLVKHFHINIYIHIHWQFLINNSCFWSVILYCGNLILYLKRDKIKSKILLWKAIRKIPKKVYQNVKVLFWTHPTDPWCSVLQTSGRRIKYNWLEIASGTHSLFHLTTRKVFEQQNPIRKVISLGKLNSSPRSALI